MENKLVIKASQVLPLFHSKNAEIWKFIEMGQDILSTVIKLHPLAKAYVAS